MTNLARFTINGTPSSQGGYDIDPGDTLTFALEASSSLVGRVTFDTPRRTAGAPALTLSNGTTTGSAVDAATPSANVTVSAGVPADRAPHLWEIRCRVNGGTNSDGSVNPDFVSSRYIAMRSSLGARKILSSERNEYDPVDAWAGAFNEHVVATSKPPTVIVPLSKFRFPSTGWNDVITTIHLLNQNDVADARVAIADVTDLIPSSGRLVGIGMSVDPFSHAALPQYMLQIEMLRAAIGDGATSPAMTQIAVAVDGSVNTTNYALQHEVAAAQSGIVLNTILYRYFVRITGEYGANAVVNTRVSRVYFNIGAP